MATLWYRFEKLLALRRTINTSSPSPFSAKSVGFSGVAAQRDLAFIEEFWSYKDPKGLDTLCDEFGCSRLYGTSPNKVYYVIDIAQIIGPAPITPDPVNPTIPYGAFNGISQHRRKTKYQDARTDSKNGHGDGSPLYIVNKWAFRWGL